MPRPHPFPSAALLPALEQLSRRPLLRDGDGFAVPGLGGLDVVRAAALGPDLTEVLGTLAQPAVGAMNAPRSAILRHHWLPGLWLALLASLPPAS